MKEFGLKRTRYKVYIYNEFGNAIECHGYKTLEELEGALFKHEFSHVPFKAYVGKELYCRHTCWNNSREYQRLCNEYKKRVA